MIISDIQIHRDGGTIEFTIHLKPKMVVRLDTPLRGEPRELRVNDVVLRKGNPLIPRLLEGIDRWMRKMDPLDLEMTLDVMAHAGPYHHPDDTVIRAIDRSHVVEVRDYLIKAYA
jgi:hypothetical protein